jgi:hypothetical protein
MIALRKVQSMGIQMWTKYKIYNLYTQILVSNWWDLSNTKPEHGREVLAKWKHEMHMSFKHTRTNMNKDSKECMYQGT